jgi:hypothetical protein
MTDYKATPEQWRQIENSQVFNATFQTCVLELRARVEALEANTHQWRSDHLQLANACASLAPDRTKFFADLLPDGDQDIDFDPTSNLTEIRSSLVDQVRDAIASEYEPADWCYDEARAAIREVAKWLKSNAGGTRAAWMLEQELKR